MRASVGKCLVFSRKDPLSCLNWWSPIFDVCKPENILGDTLHSNDLGPCTTYVGRTMRVFLDHKVQAYYVYCCCSHAYHPILRLQVALRLWLYYDTDYITTATAITITTTTITTTTTTIAPIAVWAPYGNPAGGPGAGRPPGGWFRLGCGMGSVRARRCWYRRVIWINEGKFSLSGCGPNTNCGRPRMKPSLLLIAKLF